MTALAQLDDVHFELSARNDLSILLRDSDQLSHILHAPDWLAYLSCDGR